MPAVEKKLKFVSPMPYKDAKDYFKDFFVENKVRDAKFSYRVFANLLNWPASYLSDLSSGRKNLSVTRALEFANYFKMNNAQKEHMLWLALAHSPKNQSDQLLQEKSKTDPNPSLYQKEAGMDQVLWSDIVWALRLMTWKKKRLSVREIEENFEIPGISSLRMQNALDRIEKEKYLQWDDNGELIEGSPLTAAPAEFDHSTTKGDAPYQGIELHRDAVNNFLTFIENPQSPSTYHNHPVVIPRGQFMPVAMKLIELRNWIDELSRQHLAQSKSPSTDSYLMQLDLNLFPLTKKK